MTPTDRMLTATDAADAVGLSIAAFWRGVASGRLPAPLYPAPKAPRWRYSELMAALEATRALPREAMAERRRINLAKRKERNTP